MVYKYIFNKKKNLKSNKLFLLVATFFLLFIFIFNYNFNTQTIIIPEYKGNYYQIPRDKGGQKVFNTDKKSLNSQVNVNFENEFINIDEINFSIQFFTNSEFSNVNNFLSKLINSKESIFKKDEFFIFTFHSQVGVEYFLLYKNFNTREKAYNYCTKYLTKLEKCLIVDVKQFKN